MPHSIHDGCPFDAPEGYAPSCLVLEELVSFGVLSHLRSGSRLDVSPFPPFLAQARAAVTVLLLVAHGLQLYMSPALCRRPHYLPLLAAAIAECHS